MSSNKIHKARRYGDQMYCSVCGSTWDTDDDPPEQCIPTTITFHRGEEPKNKITAEHWGKLKEALMTGDWSYFDGEQDGEGPGGN